MIGHLLDTLTTIPFALFLTVLPWEASVLSSISNFTDGNSPSPNTLSLNSYRHQDYPDAHLPGCLRHFIWSTLTNPPERDCVVLYLTIFLAVSSWYLSSECLWLQHWSSYSTQFCYQRHSVYSKFKLRLMVLHFDCLSWYLVKMEILPEMFQVFHCLTFPLPYCLMIIQSLTSYASFLLSWNHFPVAPPNSNYWSLG